MSPISFDPSTAEDPATRDALERIMMWWRGHSDKRTLDPRELVRALPDVEPVALADGLHLLRSEGLLRLVYMVESPEGVLLGGEYGSPMEVPDVVEGRFAQPVSTEDLRIVQVFREAV